MKIHVNLFLGKVVSIASQLHSFLSLFLSFFLSFFLTLMSFVFQCFSFFIPGTRLNNPQSVFNSSCFKESLNFLAFSSLSFFFLSSSPGSRLLLSFGFSIILLFYPFLRSLFMRVVVKVILFSSFFLWERKEEDFYYHTPSILIFLGSEEDGVQQEKQQQLIREHGETLLRCGKRGKSQGKETKLGNQYLNEELLNPCGNYHF